MRTLLALAGGLMIGLPLAAALAQHVPSNARPHPAGGAHANALAAAAGAIRIEACTLATRALVEDLERSDPGAAMANFDAQLRGAMDAQQLGEAWASIGARLGRLVARKPTQNVLYEGMVVITQPLQFEKGDLGLELACNQAGRFAALHFRPLTPARPSVE